MATEVLLSIVVLSWNRLELTRRCVESLRATTDVSYELIIVDNGSTDGSAEYAAEAADHVVVNQENLGFAPGMNCGLAVASGEFIAFVNNDTEFPPGWAATLLSNFDTNPKVGIVAPAVTAAGNPVTVRSTPGDEVVVLLPFAELPSGVVYVMWTGIMRELGGWNETYQVATSEDLDLCFTIWTNDLDVILDTRVLVDHVSQGSLSERSDRQDLWRTNINQFLARWQKDSEVIRLESCDSAIHARNRIHAQVAATWLARLIECRDACRELKRNLEQASNATTSQAVQPPQGSKHRLVRWFRP